MKVLFFFSASFRSNLTNFRCSKIFVSPLFLPTFFPNSDFPFSSVSYFFFTNCFPLRNLHSHLSVCPSLVQAMRKQPRSMVATAIVPSHSSSTLTRTQLSWVLLRYAGVQTMNLDFCSTRCTTTPSPNITPLT